MIALHKFFLFAECVTIYAHFHDSGEMVAFTRGDVFARASLLIEDASLVALEPGA